MTLAEEKIKQASTRFQLISVRCRRHLSATLQSLGGGLYSVDLGFLPVMAFAAPTTGLLRYTNTSLSANLTQVTSVANNDEFSISDSGVLTVKLASAPNNTTNQIILNHVLLLSGRETQIAEVGFSNETLASWQPLLTSSARVSQSIRNITAGLMSQEVTSFTATDDENYYLNNFLGPDDSLNNGEVYIWSCYGDVSNRLIIFQGRITRVNRSGNEVSFVAEDLGYKFSQPAYVHSNLYDAIYTDNQTTGGAVTIFPGDRGKPIPMNFALQSYYKTVDLTPLSGTTGAVFRSITEANNAVCTNYSTTVSTSTNRLWHLCRNYGNLRTQSFGAIEAEFDTGIGLRYVRFASYSNLYVGDDISWIESSTTYYGTIAHVGTFTHSSVTYNVAIGYVFQPFTTSSTMIARKAMHITMYGDDSVPLGARLYQSRDYSVTETTLDSKSKMVTITFVNNFESFTVSLDTLDPNKHQISYKISSDADLNHSDVLDYLLDDKLGFFTLSSSFTAAKTALSDTVSFSIPYQGESNYSPYSRYLADLLASTFGYITFKPNGAFIYVTYNLFSAPAPTETRDETTLLTPAEIQIDSQDIVTALNLSNPHLPAGTSFVSGIVTTSSKPYVLNNLGQNITKDLVHLLQTTTGDIGRSDEILSFQSNKQTIYLVSTASIDAETFIGDDLYIHHPGLTSGPIAVKVIGYTRDDNKITLETSPLSGL